MAIGQVQHTSQAHGIQTGLDDLRRQGEDQNPMNLVKRYRGHQQVGVVFDDGFKYQTIRACLEKLYPSRRVHHIHSQPLSASLGGSVWPKSKSLSMP